LKKLLIIGGSDAGISAALRAKELMPDARVTVITEDYYPNFSICGLPFLISGEVSHWEALAHRTIPEIEQAGIELLVGKKVEFINPAAKKIRVRQEDHAVAEYAYDRLLMATGGVSARPPLRGSDSEGVFFLRWIDEGRKILSYLAQRSVKNAVVIGGGYIGVEMADALGKRGIDVTVVEYARTLLTTMDEEMSDYVRHELEQKGVRVRTGMPVKEIERSDQGFILINPKGEKLPADMVIIAVGSKPHADLARQAGIALGATGAIDVDRQMRTNQPDIFAAGDCAEVWHRILDKNVYLPLGTTAHKQGRIAGENMVGRSARHEGTCGTQVVAVFDLVIARTGLRDGEAAAAGFMPLTEQLETWDHKFYYPAARKIVIRITGDIKTGKLLGAQIVGHRSSEVAKRIDVFATALYSDMKVEDIDKLDLSYTPPLSTPWDPVQMAAHAWSEKIRKKFL
jgi:NADPH-dependent 2,4-dienoyl-CoA reductase/sulfur reductase-like enzyme